MKEKGKSSLTVCLYSVQPRRRNLYQRHRPQGYLDSKSRSSGRCPRSADRTTNLGLPVLGTVPSVSGPIDQTLSTGAWDGALGQRTDNLVYWCLGRCPWCAGPRTRKAAKPAEPSRAAKPAGLSASTLRKLLGRLPDREVNPRTRPDRDQHRSRPTAALNVKTAHHGTARRGHIRPCLQAYHGIPHRDNTAIHARNAKPGSTKIATKPIMRTKAGKREEENIDNCSGAKKIGKQRIQRKLQCSANSSYNRAQCRDRTQGTGSPMRCHARVTASESTRRRPCVKSSVWSRTAVECTVQNRSGHEDNSLELMLETSGDLIHVLPLVQQRASSG